MHRTRAVHKRSESVTDDLNRTYWRRPKAGVIYDLEFRNLVGRFADRSETEPLLDLVGGLKGKKILEVGCGTGRFLKLFDSSNELYGLDVSEEMLQIARQRNPGASLHVGSAELLPFDSGAFDVVYCFRVLQHIVNQEKVVHEIARVTKPGGMVILVTYNSWSPLNLYKHLRMSSAGRILNIPFALILGRRSFFGPWGFLYDNYCSMPELQRWMDHSAIASRLSWGVTCWMPWFFNSFFLGKVLEMTIPTFFRWFLSSCLWCDRHIARYAPVKYFMDLILLMGEKRQ